ncbi:hypothetical protein ML8HA_00930 [Lactococcus lactis]|nr:prophage protein [Lactococcus lactis subsp. lactis]ARE04360.1 prophage protein [Lactococcus lactis subsp. lactis]MDU0405133.1 hypothetical protein [Lactococcus lactis]
MIKKVWDYIKVGGKFYYKFPSIHGVLSGAIIMIPIIIIKFLIK